MFQNSSRAREAQQLGLQSRHAYTITKVVEIRSPKVRSGIPLVRLRNPHGNSKEWKGDWSDEWVSKSKFCIPFRQWRQNPLELILIQNSLLLKYKYFRNSYFKVFWLSFQDVKYFLNYLFCLAIGIVFADLFRFYETCQKTKRD